MQRCMLRLLRSHKSSYSHISIFTFWDILCLSLLLIFFCPTLINNCPLSILLQICTGYSFVLTFLSRDESDSIFKRKYFLRMWIKQVLILRNLRLLLTTSQFMAFTVSQNLFSDESAINLQSILFSIFAHQYYCFSN